VRADVAVREVVDPVRALELTGIAQRSGRGDWQITDPLLARYLADLPGA
jgi:hypothetical protein